MKIAALVAADVVRNERLEILGFMVLSWVLSDGYENLMNHFFRSLCRISASFVAIFFLNSATTSW